MQVILDEQGHVVDWLHLALNSNFSRVTGIPDITGRLASEVFPDLEGEWFSRMDRLDAAVLDINLEGDASYPIAEVLAEDGVPFVFLTGNDAWSLPESYAKTPTLAKPYADAAVIDAVTRLCRAKRPR